jgi:alpha-beta hydrolase superfamily lysophospholipase
MERPFISKESQSYWQAADGLRMFARLWEPCSPPAGVVVLVHGIGEHIGRYAHVAAAFCAAGYVLTGFDLRGHGQSAGKRGYTASYQALLDDITVFLDLTRQSQPDLPLFLYGHSLGGNLVLNYALRRATLLSGVIATGPELRLSFTPPAWKVWLGRLLVKVWPTFTQASELDITGLSHDPEVIAAYQADPLVHDRVSAQLFLGFIEAGEWALQHAAEFAHPLLLMHGGADSITSADATRQFAAAVRTGCTLKIWEGCRHEIHNEPAVKAQVLQVMTDWLRSQTH